jgi:RimJ/RimL family protein N-acetyltransferase
MLCLREANNNDILFYFQIRNIPEVYKGFYSGCGVNWQTHVAWWQTRHNWQKFIIEVDREPAGFVNIGQLDHWSPEIGYALHPDYWSQGYGTEAVKTALIWLKTRLYSHCHTTCLKDNKWSLQLLRGLDFKIMGDAREGEYWLTKSIL